MRRSIVISWHRFYDPSTGRYITADPIGLAGGMNLYAYVGGDPVNFVDPRGLAFGVVAVLPVIPEVGTAVLGALTGLALAVAIDELIEQLDEQRDEGVRSIPKPKEPRCGCTCICRADADDNMPGNIIAGRPLFQFGVANANNCSQATKDAKRQATQKLGMKPKHIDCRCAGK